MKKVKKKNLKKQTKKKTPTKSKKNIIKKKKKPLITKKSIIKNKKKSVTKKKKTSEKNNTNKKTKSKIAEKNNDSKLISKIKKTSLSFDDKIKEVFEKLINKNKIDGIYTIKILEKAIPKKFRVPENLQKLESLITKSNIKIYTEEEAKELLNLSKEASNKSEEGTDEEEKKQTGKTDDPVRLYLRDMGAVELLSREGEIAIAKRIEAGREKMIGAICESPMTIRSIINWKDAIKDGTMLLRDIVDLEATYDMSDISDNKLEDTLKLIEGATEKEEKKQSEEKKTGDDNENNEDQNNEEDE